jgi:PAS domain S-box-containing protein
MHATTATPTLRELARAGDAYRFLFSEGELAVFLMADVIEDCNEAVCRMLGCARGEIVGRSMLEYSSPIQPDGSPAEEAGRRRVESALAGLPQWCRWQYRRKDGEAVDALVTVEAVRVDGARRLLMRARDLSKLERAEALLRENELRLQQILDNSTTVRLFAKDLAGRYLFVNRAFEQHAGRPAAEIVGLTPADIAPADIAAGLRANDRRVIETGSPLEVEETNIIRGERRTLLANKFPLLGADGRPYAVCGISIDITERKRNEEALHCAALAVSTAAGPNVFEALARDLAGILGVGAVMISVFSDAAQTRLRTLGTWLDGRALKSFEYDLAKTPCAGVLGREFRFVPSGVQPEFAPGTMFQALGFDSYAAYSLNDASGRQLGLIAALDRKPLADRKLTEGMLKIFAVKAAAELERARADEALRASESSYRSIFEASEDAIFIHDWDTGRILDVSPKAAELYGWGREELREMRVGDVSANVPPYTEQDAMRLVQQAKVRSSPLRFEWHARHKDGHLLWVEVTLKRATIAGEPRVLAFVRNVTERKLAEEAVRASEEQYRAIFNASADALVLWNSELKRVDVNPAYERLYGFTREEVLNTAYPDHLPVEYVERRRELVRRTLAGESCQVELEALRKNGERIQVEVRTIPIRHRGEPHVLAIVRDITERKRAEEALRASEEQYRAIFNASADGLTLRDAQFRVVDVNPASLAMTGFTREEVLGSDRMLFTPQEDHATAREMFARELRGEVTSHETEAVRKDGTRFALEVRGVPLQYRGQPHVFVIARDITGRKRAEEALRTSGEQYRAIFNASADALVLRDADFRIVDVNAAYCAMSGYAREDVLGADHVVANPRAIDGQIKTLHRKALAGEPIQFEAEWVRKDGSRSEVEVRGLPIQHRERPHVLYIGRDIAARKQAEAERLALEAQLRQAQKMEAIGQLTGGIAHDFNNILTSIVGYVTLAAERDGATGDAKLAGYLEQATRSCRRARDLIQQMLTFSRGQRGERRPVDLKKLVTESARLLHSSMPATFDLQTANGESVPLVSLDPVQAEQVLLNLCINARDALQGHGQVRIAVRRARHAAVCASCKATVAGEFVELAVSDDGPGIAPEVMERMFEPFYSTKEVGKGSGMGLAMVHGIVHDHGGHLIVETAPGKGATFRALFPALGADDGQVEHETLTGFASPARKALLHGRVLLVDDEEMVRGFMRELLEGWGLEVAVARDGTEAREAFARAPADYDLVITDQTMPRLTGMELAREILAQRPSLPVVLYSGYADAITDAQVQAAGLRALIRKPVEPTALRALLEGLLPPAARAA